MATQLDLTDYTAPDHELFVTRFPMFAAVDSGLVELTLQEAGTHVDNCWLASDYQMAILYLTAHLLWAEGYPLRAEVAALEAAGAGPGPGGTTTGACGGYTNLGVTVGGQIKSTTVDDVKTEFYATGDSVSSGGFGPGLGSNRCCPEGEEGYRFSTFGQMFLKLRKRNMSHPRTVRCGTYYCGC